MEQQILQPDFIISDTPYKILQLIGKGAYGFVYQGIDLQNDRLLAIKQLKDLQNQHYFYQEKENLKKIKSESIVEFIDYIQTKEGIFLIMEYCSQGDLRSFILQHYPSGIVPEDVALTFLKQIITGLKELYNLRIVHRDLKPENILIHNYQLKISDFGLSKQLTDSCSQTGSYAGTLKYMGPEIFEQYYLNNGKYGMQCDIYSVGIILYVILYGKFPFKGEGKASFITHALVDNIDFKNENLSQEMIDLLKKMLEKDAEKRISLFFLQNHKLVFKAQDQLNVVELLQNQENNLDDGELSQFELLKREFLELENNQKKNLNSQKLNPFSIIKTQSVLSYDEQIQNINETLKHYNHIKNSLNLIENYLKYQDSISCIRLEDGFIFQDIDTLPLQFLAYRYMSHHYNLVLVDILFQANKYHCKFPSQLYKCQEIADIKEHCSEKYQQVQEFFQNESDDISKIQLQQFYPDFSENSNKPYKKYCIQYLTQLKQILNKLNLSSLQKICKHLIQLIEISHIQDIILKIDYNFNENQQKIINIASIEDQDLILQVINEEIEQATEFINKQDFTAL